MIHSITDLLVHIQTEFEEPFILRNSVYGTALHTNLHSSPNLPHHFLCPSAELQLKRTCALRFACVQSFFFHLSWQEKRSFLHDFVEQIGTTRALDLLISTLSDDLHGKLYTHSRSIVSTNFPYDQVYKDDNRCMDVKVSKEVREDSIVWFKEQPDRQQVSMIVTLVRLAAGAMVPVVLAFGTDRKRRLLKNEAERPLPPTLPQTDSRTRLHSNVSPRESLILLQRVESKVDPNDHEFAKVLKMRKSWEDLVAKYKAEVEGKVVPKKKAVRKGKKVNKKKAKGKKGKLSGEEEIDMIQLLPIWIVKQIFSYLDKNTLQKITKVNSYWKFAANDVLKEMDMRKTINKTIKNIEDELLQSGGYPSAIYPTHPTFPRKTTLTKRMSKLQKTGCTFKKLRNPIKHEIFTSLLSEAPRDMADEYILPVEEVIPFPRNYKPESKITDKRSMLFLDAGLYVSLKKKGSQTEIAGGVPQAPDSEEFCDIEIEGTHFKTPATSSRLPQESVCDMMAKEHAHKV